MKVIFLDHDGVICLPEQWGSRERKQQNINELIPIEYYNLYSRLDNFDKKAIKILNEIIKETDCEIVVSSDWKYIVTLEEMGWYYEQQGIIKKPIAYVDTIDYKEYMDYIHINGYGYGLAYESNHIRSFEIKKYLVKHPEITHWVAIDDLDMRYYAYDYSGEIIIPWGLKNFVFTRYNEGLKQTGLKDKIIKYLK